ncbi:uncharacterized protein VTP21DRAFT_4365 [Calcarisporiella thermophila]|uniref:uncharacterized protein n=1 Tax=Calcarisporiella thermophila TaxID=911321 RepID=UPI003742F0D9
MPCSLFSYCSILEFQEMPGDAHFSSRHAAEQTSGNIIPEVPSSWLNTKEMQQKARMRQLELLEEELQVMASKLGIDAIDDPAINNGRLINSEGNFGTRGVKQDAAYGFSRDGSLLHPQPAPDNRTPYSPHTSSASRTFKGQRYVSSSGSHMFSAETSPAPRLNVSQPSSPLSFSNSSIASSGYNSFKDSRNENDFTDTSLPTPRHNRLDSLTVSNAMGLSNSISFPTSPSLSTEKEWRLAYQKMPDYPPNIDAYLSQKSSLSSANTEEITKAQKPYYPSSENFQSESSSPSSSKRASSSAAGSRRASSRGFSELEEFGQNSRPSSRSKSRPKSRSKKSPPPPLPSIATSTYLQNTTPKPSAASNASSHSQKNWPSTGDSSDMHFFTPDHYSSSRDQRSKSLAFSSDNGAQRLPTEGDFDPHKADPGYLNRTSLPASAFTAHSASSTSGRTSAAKSARNSHGHHSRSRSRTSVGASDSSRRVSSNVGHYSPPLIFDEEEVVPPVPPVPKHHSMVGNKTPGQEKTYDPPVPTLPRQALSTYIPHYSSVDMSPGNGTVRGAELATNSDLSPKYERTRTTVKLPPVPLADTRESGTRTEISEKDMPLSAGLSEQVLSEFDPDESSMAPVVTITKTTRKRGKTLPSSFAQPQPVPSLPLPPMKLQPLMNPTSPLRSPLPPSSVTPMLAEDSQLEFYGNKASDPKFLSSSANIGSYSNLSSPTTPHGQSTAGMAPSLSLGSGLKSYAGLANPSEGSSREVLTNGPPMHTSVSSATWYNTTSTASIQESGTGHTTPRSPRVERLEPVPNGIKAYTDPRPRRRTVTTPSQENAYQPSAVTPSLPSPSQPHAGPRQSYLQASSAYLKQKPVQASALLSPTATTTTTTAPAVSSAYRSRNEYASPGVHPSEKARPDAAWDRVAAVSAATASLVVHNEAILPKDYRGSGSSGNPSLATGKEKRTRRGIAPAMSPSTALKIYGNQLSPYERSEIMDFSHVYYVGHRSAKKMATLENASNNFGYDDDRGDYQVIPGDHLAYRFEIIEALGKGSFGQVVQCHDHKTGETLAVKLIRNKKRFHCQAQVEIRILESINKWDPEDRHNCVRMKDRFHFRGHLCIAFECLSLNLYEFIKSNNFQGFSLSLICRFAVQLLAALSLLARHRVVHCDLKPENVLLKDPTKSGIKVIDFGSSCFENEKVYTYIQSRFYRSPEVILGLSYHTAIDMWSFGCILAELYTGYPLFPGENEQDQLACIMEIIGVPDPYIIERSSRKKLFFDSMGRPRPYTNSKGRRRRPGAKSLQHVLRCNDPEFVDFIARTLHWDPDKRLRPDEAMLHPWIMGCVRPKLQQPVFYQQQYQQQYHNIESMRYPGASGVNGRKEDAPMSGHGGERKLSESSVMQPRHHRAFSHVHSKYTSAAYNG